MKQDGKVLAIEAKLRVSGSDTISYNMTNMAKHTYQLRFAPQNMQSSGVQAFLLDKFLNTSTPISLTDSSFINVAITSNAASAAADRFKVVFKQVSALPVTFTSIKATPKNGEVMVEWNVENESGMQQYEVETSPDGIKFTGASMVRAENQGKGKYQWTDLHPVVGNNYYRIKSISRDGSINYTSVVKVVIAPPTGGISVYPNPVLDRTINLHLTNQPAGIYEIRLIN